MADYDVKAAFRAIEEELLASMIRNLANHRAQETAEGIQWSQWQVEQLAALERYKKRNRKKLPAVFAEINAEIQRAILLQRAAGQADQEISILEAAKLGRKLGKAAKQGAMEGSFQDINDRKLNALLQATTHDMEQAEHAILRRANDAYRKIIFNAQVYANTGAGTYEKAVDMATRDFLRSGIQCVVYKDGSQHSLSDYADMALRTASKRAYLQGEGERRQEWGISTVIVNKRGGACPKCARFCGKVFIDDVWSGGKAEDGNYPLLSSAIAAGLYHPRCKDAHSTYFPGLTEVDEPWTTVELKRLEGKERAEQRQQYAQRQAERYDRLARYSLDTENQERYASLVDKWEMTYRGLSVGDFESAESDIPRMVKEIDSRDTALIMEELERAQSDFAKLDHEEDLTITDDGKVWHTRGSAGNVNPWGIEKLGSSLKNSYSYHNHPANETRYSLSAEDVRFFFDSGQCFSKAADDVYEYAMMRTKETLDVDGETAYHRFREIYKNDIYELSWNGLIDIDENGYHETMKRLSEEYHFLYARRLLNASE